MNYLIWSKSNLSALYKFGFWPYRSPWHRVYLSCVCSLHWESERRRRRETRVLQSAWTFLGLVYTEDGEKGQRGLMSLKNKSNKRTDKIQPSIFYQHFDHTPGHGVLEPFSDGVLCRCRYTLDRSTKFIAGPNIENDHKKFTIYW